MEKTPGKMEKKTMTFICYNCSNTDPNKCKCNFILWGWKNGEKIFMDKLDHEIRRKKDHE